LDTKINYQNIKSSLGRIKSKPSFFSRFFVALNGSQKPLESHQISFFPKQMKTASELNNLLDGYSQEAQQYHQQHQQSITGMFSGWTKRSASAGGQGYAKSPNLKLSTKPTIFGMPLANALDRSNRAVGKQERIPRIAARCIEYLDARGISLFDKGYDELGIYRLSGSTKEVQALRAQFDQYQDVNLMQDFRDPNAVASLFKAYVRERKFCCLI
jgi:RhoGAP domain